MKFAAMVSPFRATDKKYIDAADFMSHCLPRVPVVMTCRAVSARPAGVYPGGERNRRNGPPRPRRRTTRTVTSLQGPSPGYGASPRTLNHRMRLSVSSSASSASSKSSSSDFFAQSQRLALQLASAAGSSRPAGSCSARAVYGVRSGVSWKQPRIGVADRSSWFIGGRPRISSIVLTMPVWL